MLTDTQYRNQLSSVLIPANLVETTDDPIDGPKRWCYGANRSLLHNYWLVRTADPKLVRNGERVLSFDSALDVADGRWGGITPLHDALTLRLVCVEIVKGEGSPISKPPTAEWTAKLMGYLEWIIRWRNSISIDYFAEISEDHYQQYRKDAAVTDITRLVPLATRLDALLENPNFTLPLVPYGAKTRIDWNAFTRTLGVTSRSVGRSKLFHDEFIKRVPLFLDNAGVDPKRVVLFVNQNHRLEDAKPSISHYRHLPWQIVERLSIKGLINHDPLKFRPSQIPGWAHRGKKQRTNILLPNDLQRLFQLSAIWVLGFAPFILRCLRERERLNPERQYLNVRFVTELMTKLNSFRPHGLAPLSLGVGPRFPTPEGYLPLADALKYLFVAVAILIGGFGGRRREEVNGLRSHPLFKENGLTYLSIYIEKTLRAVDAIPVPEIVEKAVSLLEKLSEHARKSSGDDRLFAFKSNFADDKSLRVDTEFFNNLNAFVAHCGLAPPDGDLVWALNFHMFRKAFVTSFYHGNLKGEFDAVNWTLRHRSVDMSRIYMDDESTGAISYLENEVQRLTARALENLSAAELKYLADAKEVLKENSLNRKIWNTKRQEFFVWAFMKTYDGEQRPIGRGAVGILAMLKEMEERAYARIRLSGFSSNGPVDVRSDVKKQVETIAATEFLEPVPGVPLYCRFQKGREDDAHLAECLKLRDSERAPWRQAQAQHPRRWPDYNFSGLFPCLHCPLGVALNENQQTIETIIEKHKETIPLSATVGQEMSAREWLTEAINGLSGAQEAVHGRQRP